MHCTRDPEVPQSINFPIHGHGHAIIYSMYSHPDHHYSKEEHIRMGGSSKSVQLHQKPVVWSKLLVTPGHARTRLTSTQHAQYVLLFSVLAVNSNQFLILQSCMLLL